MRAESFRAGLALLSARYRVRVSDGALSATGYLAGDDNRRADELDGYLRDPEVRAILVARGGYGLLRIIDRLDPATLRADPVPIVGFSDATVLLAWALAAGVRPIHGPVVNQLAELPADDQAEYVRVLEDATAPAPVDGLEAIGAAGDVNGRLVGGNLSLLAHLAGTPWAVDARDGVLLVEDVGERPYAIDRYVTRIALAGGLDGCRGAVLGELTRCVEPDGTGPTAADVLHERLQRYGITGRAGAPIGHGARNRAVPLGARVRLVGQRMEILDPAVE